MQEDDWRARADAFVVKRELANREPARRDSIFHGDYFSWRFGFACEIYHRPASRPNTARANNGIKPAKPFFTGRCAIGFGFLLRHARAAAPRGCARVGAGFCF
jgi:hypothetical protein